MLNATHTTVQWRDHAGDVLVLPVGAMEQHGAHLPLNTDTIHAEYFGHVIAEHFDAALLPALPISNSFEHSGFRGTFSFRPETLMQMVRDLVDEAASQGFTILVIVNGHGGNFALGPVCRDINRRDGRCKVILIGSWQFTPPGVASASVERRMELHAGENETSGMMFIAPERVGPLVPGQGMLTWDVPFQAPDLNTFGIDHVSPDGPVGDFTRASAEQGRRMTEACIPPMLRFLEDRIARLRRHGNYAARRANT